MAKDVINLSGDKKGTKSIILQTLRIYGPISRITLVEATGLSRATISQAIADLIAQGMVHETERRQHTGGRPATVLELTPGTSTIIGAEFDNEKWIIGAFDLIGNVMKSIKIPVLKPTPEEAIAVLLHHLKDFIASLNDPIELIGLGLPGLVDSKQGIIVSAIDLGWYHIEVERMIRSNIGWPTVVLNRHKARGLYECRFGAGQDCNEMVYLGVGTGIVAGLFVNRQLISGTVGGAGEVGHVTIEPNGQLCPCGNRGCLQLYASALAIEQEAKNLLSYSQESLLCADPDVDLQHLKAEQICHAAEMGDALAMRVIKEVASYLGIAIANLVNTNNPHAIILGGPIPRMSKLYVETAIEVMKQRALRPLADKTIVRTASFNEFGGALGAANFTLDQYMSYSLLNPWDEQSNGAAKRAK